MTREQIEKAAMLSCASKDEVLTDFGSSCFIEGVQWRINSVWKKPSAYGEELTRNVNVIAKTTRGCYRFGKFDVVGYSREYIGFASTSTLEYALSDILEYAYLEDLLPERKEGTNGGR